jgi:hypothetical protein
MKDMVHEVEPFMSKHDLESGTRWGQALAQQLEDTSFGLLCLTPDNLSKPWLLFEAGALTKHAEGRACCLLLNGLRPADVSGPLAQFQNRTFDEENMKLLMRDVNAKLREPLQPDRLARAFAKWWPDLDSEVGVAIKVSVSQSSKPARRQREQSEIMEELLVRVREIQANLAAADIDPERGSLIAHTETEGRARKGRPVDLADLLATVTSMPKTYQDIFLRLLDDDDGIDESVLRSKAVSTLVQSGLVNRSKIGFVMVPDYVRKLLAGHNGWWSGREISKAPSAGSNLENSTRK